MKSATAAAETGLGYSHGGDDLPVFANEGEEVMAVKLRSTSPTILLRICDGSVHMHRSFNDFAQAVRSAEAFAGAGFSVAMMSATGRFLMAFEPKKGGRAAV